MPNFKYWLTFSKSLLCAVLLTISYCAQAVVNIDRTRVIFDTGKNNTSFNLINESAEQPALIQIWIDEGDPTLAPDKIKSPVIILEPIFSLAAQEQRNVKLILPNPEEIMRDRESVYWLNILQIPPAQKLEAGQQRVFLPLRIRLKLLIRPDQVKAPIQADLSKLQFLQNGNTLQINNPTPWNITLTSIQADQLKLKDVMVLAKGQYTFKLAQPLETGTVIEFSVINDQGTLWPMQIKLK